MSRVDASSGGSLSGCLLGLAAMVAVVFAGFAVSGAAAATHAFPTGSGWANPVGSGAFNNWGFKSCSPPYYGNSAHIGTDSQGAPAGRAVVAIAAGKIVQAPSYKYGDAGRVVGIEHKTGAGKRFLAIYGHINPSKKGGSVSKGQKIGTVANQGRNSHLHFGIRLLGAKEAANKVAMPGMAKCSSKMPSALVDPMPWLKVNKATPPPPPPPPAVADTTTAQTSRGAGDFNGDGRDDMAILYRYGANDTGVNAMFGSPSGLVAGWHRPWRDTKTWSWDKSKPMSGDFNGDGRDDMAILYRYGTSDTGVNVMLGSPTGLKAGWLRPWRDTKTWSWDLSKPAVGDFNGDGKDDMAVLYRYGKSDTGVNVMLGSPTGLKAGWHRPWRDTKTWSWDLSKPFSGDFNGDGKDDMAVLYRYGASDTGVNVMFGSPSGLVAQWHRPWRDTKTWSWDKSKPMSGDFNGDGRDDMAILYRYGTSDTGVNVMFGSPTGLVWAWHRPWRDTKTWSWDLSK